MAYRVERWAMTIEFGHCDPAKIVYYPRYQEFFDHNSWRYLSAVLGVGRNEIPDALGVIGFPLVDVHSRFMAPSRFGDDVELTTTISEFRRSSFVMKHELLNKGILAVECHETRVWAGSDPENPARLKAMPIPPDIIERFKAAA
jgi:4-hydroxybenzoyl-CoA thioesterase